MHGSTEPPGELPGRTTAISARRVLVIAPHADDDVIGCGGLLKQLADDRAEIHVLFLTDSGGGAEIAAGPAYAERRRGEAARGLAALGIDAPPTFLEIPDGRLEEHRQAASESIEQTLRTHRPDLILGLSPLEITADHRAAFGALFDVLSPLREGSDLLTILRDTSVLLYEVNHPAHPDVLVDVSEHVDAITDAIRAHESQLELHNYLEAAMGLRRYRALSLPKDVTAVEAYRRVTIDDFRTHGSSGLIRALGGVPDRHHITSGPLVSVIVRTKDRPELLGEALDSIAGNIYRRVELVLVNDGGAAPAVPDGFPFPVRRIDLPENRGRAAAANEGVAAAGGEYVTFLDDDDLMEAEHLATLTGLVSAAGVRVAYTDAAIGVYELDENGWHRTERRLTYSRDFDPDLLLVDNFIPFNTLIIEKAAALEAGPFDEGLEFFEDWDFLIRLAQITPFHHRPRVTCEYRHFRGAGHHVLGDRPRQREDFLEYKARVIANHLSLQSPQLLARVIDGLRAESVDLGEERDALRTEAKTLRDEHSLLQSDYHRLNGEAVGLREERPKLVARIEELDAAVRTGRDENRRARQRIEELDEEVRGLYAANDESAQHLARTYAEIERLEGIIAAMESTRAWRLHRRLERLKSTLRGAPDD